MITNERQYKITNSQLDKLKNEVDDFNLNEVAKRVGSKVLAKAELDAFLSEIEILGNQLREYEELKSGTVTSFQANSLAELPVVLIRARIAQNLSQRELGELVGLKEQQIQRYESDYYASASLKRIREIADALKLNIIEIAEISSATKLSSDFDWNRFPVKEMYKRGWFEGFYGSITDLIQIANELVEEYVTTFFQKPSMALHRKLVRSGSQLDPYALLAWECRILDLASKVEPVTGYQPSKLTDKWFEKLRKLSKLDDGPIQAKAMLEEVGITLVIEPHLPGTYLDGAALLFNGESPIIGLTLRYDRLDNFWFVLFHELIHVAKHLELGKLENIFDDLDINVEDDIEKEADMLAGNLLIPPAEWDIALPRYTRSAESVINFANELDVSPAIIAGRIRNEGKNFTILSDLIGQGEVRKHFPGVKFGV